MIYHQKHNNYCLVFKIWQNNLAINTKFKYDFINIYFLIVEINYLIFTF